MIRTYQFVVAIAVVVVAILLLAKRWLKFAVALLVADVVFLIAAASWDPPASAASKFLKDYKQILPISPEQCLEANTGALNHLFERTVEKTADQSHRTLIAVSLFKIQSGDDKAFVDDQWWRDKYLTQLIENLRWAQATNRRNVRIYTTRECYETLAEEVPDLNTLGCLEIVVMKHDTVSCNPGAMWRFLSLQDTRYSIVHVCDIDENWLWTKKVSKILLKCDETVLSTLKSHDTPVDHLGEEYEGQVNRALIIGSHVSVKPRFFADMNIEQVMLGFIEMSQAGKLRWSPPSRHQNWGMEYPVYGFDEYFLKRVVYFAAVRVGKVDFYSHRVAWV